MPKQHKKPPRNCFNQTQERDSRTGYFLRRQDDGAVKFSFSRPEAFFWANAAANRRSALSSAERQSRNSRAAIKAKNAR